MACEEWQAQNDPDRIHTADHSRAGGMPDAQPAPNPSLMEEFFGNDTEALERAIDRKRNRIARKAAQQERKRGRGRGRTLSQ